MTASRRTGRPDDAPPRGPRGLLFELESPDDAGAMPPALDVPDGDLDALTGGRARREPPRLPRATELDVARHFSHLAAMNFGVDTGFYPLGSCTMKYNPRLHEDLARLSGIAGLHPYQADDTVQGVLELMWELQEALAEVSGLPEVTLQPAAGAHGELTALLVFRAALHHAGAPRTRVIIPDSAHGTNPASVTMAGFEAVTVPSDEHGLVDRDRLGAVLDESVAAVMLTNPNTLGLFEESILEITEMAHAVGAFVYCDGANLNAILGKARPGDMGFDALHINLHKTFSTPHGGGGPGAGPVCVSSELGAYLPAPVVVRTDEGFSLARPERSVGRVRSFAGNVGVLVRAYAYILGLGADGLVDVAEQAVLSANYLRVGLRDVLEVPYDRICMHEFVASAASLRREYGVRTVDVAKRLLDYGIHPPTVYFPLIVAEAMMIEPTETEPLSGLDAFIDAMRAIVREAAEDAELLTGAPHTTPVRRIDEAGAARALDVRWRAEERAEERESR